MSMPEAQWMLKIEMAGNGSLGVFKFTDEQPLSNVKAAKTYSFELG